MTETTPHVDPSDVEAKARKIAAPIDDPALGMLEAQAAWIERHEQAVIHMTRRELSALLTVIDELRTALATQDTTPSEATA